MSRRVIDGSRQDLMGSSSEVGTNYRYQSHRYQEPQETLGQYSPHQHQQKRPTEGLSLEAQLFKRQRSQGPTNTHPVADHRAGQTIHGPEVNGAIHGQVQQNYRTSDTQPERSYNGVPWPDPQNREHQLTSPIFDARPRLTRPLSLVPTNHRPYQPSGPAAQGVNGNQAYAPVQLPPNSVRGFYPSPYSPRVQDRDCPTNSFTPNVYNRQASPSIPLTGPNPSYPQQTRSNYNSAANANVKYGPRTILAPKPSRYMRILDSFSDDETLLQPPEKKADNMSFGGFQPLNKRRESVGTDSSEVGSVDNPIDLDDPAPVPTSKRLKTYQIQHARSRAKTLVNSARAPKPAQTAASKALKKELQDAKKFRQQQNLDVQQNLPVQSSEKSEDHIMKEAFGATTVDKTNSLPARNEDSDATISPKSTPTPAKLDKRKSTIDQADLDQANANFEIAMNIAQGPAESQPVPTNPAKEMPNISTALYRSGFDPFSNKKSKETKIISVEEAAQIAAVSDSKRKPSAKRGQTAAERLAKEKERAEKDAQRKINAELKKEQRIKDNIRRKFRASAPEGVVHPEEVIENHVQQEFEKRKTASEKRKAAAKSGLDTGNAAQNGDEKGDSAEEATDPTAAEAQEKFEAAQKKLTEQAQKQRVNERFARAANARAGTENSESEVSEEDPDPEPDEEHEGNMLKDRERRYATPDQVIDVFGDAEDGEGSEDGMADALESALLEEENPAEPDENISKLTEIATQAGEAAVPTLDRSFNIYRIHRTFVQGGNDQPDVVIAQFVNRKKANERAEKELQAPKWGSRRYKQIAWRVNKQGLFSGSGYIDDELNGMRVVVRAELQSIDDGDPELVQTYHETAELKPNIWLIHETTKAPDLNDENATKVSTQRTIRACTSRVIANTLAGQYLLGLLKPAADSNSESLLEFEEDTAPAIRNCVDEQNESAHGLFVCETELPDGKEVGVQVEKLNVTGPRN